MQSKQDIEQSIAQMSLGRGVSSPGQMLMPDMPPSQLPVRSISSSDYPQMISDASRNVSVSQVIEEMATIDDEKYQVVANPVASVVQIYATGVKPNYTSPWM